MEATRAHVCVCGVFWVGVVDILLQQWCCDEKKKTARKHKKNACVNHTTRGGRALVFGVGGGVGVGVGGGRLRQVWLS